MRQVVLHIFQIYCISQFDMKNASLLLFALILLWIDITSSLNTHILHAYKMMSKSLPPVRRLNACRQYCSLVMSASTGVKQNIVIVGGGFGGLYTAIKLDSIKNNNLNITLIDSKDKFVFLPLLYELAVGAATCNVNGVDLTSRTITGKEVSTGSDLALKYDQCVISAGTQPRADIIPGADRHSIPFYRVTDVYNVQTKLRQLIDESPSKASIRIVIIGAGYSGVEVAANLAEYIKRMGKVPEIHLVDRNSQIMSNSPEHNRNTAKRALSSLKVTMHLSTTVKFIDENSVVIVPVSENSTEVSGVQLPADLCILTTGMQPSALLKTLAAASSAKMDGFGRLLTSKTLQCIGHPNVFALGDCATIQPYRENNEDTLPKTAQVAMQQSEIVAVNIFKRSLLYPKYDVSNVEDVHKKVSVPGQLDEFRYIPLGEMLSLGNTDAAITSLGGLVQLSGPVASAARRLVYSVRMPTDRQRATAAASAGVITAANLFTDWVGRRQQRK